MLTKLIFALRGHLANRWQALAAVRAATTFGGWDIHELPDDEDLT